MSVPPYLCTKSLVCVLTGEDQLLCLLLEFARYKVFMTTLSTV